MFLKDYGSLGIDDYLRFSSVPKSIAKEMVASFTHSTTKIYTNNEYNCVIIKSLFSFNRMNWS